MPLRVIGGQAGGRQLKAPSQGPTRPTSDRVREAVFEILTSHGAPMQNVLDLYSGSGAMGIEALSRGAQHCDFVEANARMCVLIRENLRLIGVTELAKVLNLPVGRAQGRLTPPYDLVVADPPYEYDRAEKELVDLVEKGVVAPGGVIVIEHSKRHLWPAILAGRPQLTTRRYGDTCVTIYE